MSKKPVIVFEGIEGSGKSFHINSIARYLKNKKISFVKIREPGGSSFSEQIRKLLLNKRFNLVNKTDLMLFYAARSENFEKIIKKNHQKKIILIDRFTDSTLAYQHFGMKIDLNIIKILNKFIKFRVFNGLFNSLIIYFIIGNSKRNIFSYCVIR